MDRTMIPEIGTPESRRSKAGFGLLEVVASMIIMALMSTSIMYLHYANRGIALRIQARNEATEIGMNILDSLSALSIHQVEPITDRVVMGSVRNLATGSTTARPYTVNVTTVDHTVSNQVSINSANYGSNAVLISREILVDVGFKLGDGNFHIKLSGVVK